MSDELRIRYTYNNEDVFRSQINHMEDMSAELTGMHEEIAAINPAVWNATVATMRYAAFFRYCKLEFPDEWGAFFNQIKNISTRPTVSTISVILPRTD